MVSGINIDKIQAFIHEVEARSGKSLTAEEAEILIRLVLNL